MTVYIYPGGVDGLADKTLTHCLSKLNTPSVLRQLRQNCQSISTNPFFKYFLIFFKKLQYL